jgi:hypothetical protein
MLAVANSFQSAHLRSRTLTDLNVSDCNWKTVTAKSTLQRHNAACNMCCQMSMVYGTEKLREHAAGTLAAGACTTDRAYPAPERTVRSRSCCS